MCSPRHWRARVSCHAETSWPDLARVRQPAPVRHSPECLTARILRDLGGPVRCEISMRLIRPDMSALMSFQDNGRLDLSRQRAAATAPRVARLHVKPPGIAGLHKLPACS